MMNSEQRWLRLRLARWRCVGFCWAYFISPVPDDKLSLNQPDGEKTKNGTRDMINTE
jgi:hypothetical protein